jgi:hypothetical protein
MPNVRRVQAFIARDAHVRFPPEYRVVVIYAERHGEC